MILILELFDVVELFELIMKFFFKVVVFKLVGFVLDVDEGSMINF